MSRSADPVERLFPEVEERLRHLATPMGRVDAGEWLADHPVTGQTFRQYLSANPVRRGPQLSTLYLCLLGNFAEPQEQILERSREYLGLVFDVPVQVRCRMPLSDIPARARRKHPVWGDKQVLTRYVLREVLEPDRPDDALAYLALTARDLWPGGGWNFVFGQADLRRRIGILSIYRNGYPGKSEASFRLCLRRTLLIAAHEMGHILTMRHCTAFRCLMNGCNSQEERDRTPLNPCPVCLRKLLWNLQVEPIPYLKRLEAFCREHKLAEAGWYTKVVAGLQEW